MSQPVVSDDAFAVILANDLIDGGRNCVLGQMIVAFSEHLCSILGVEDVPPGETDKHGIIDPGESDGRIIRVGILSKSQSRLTPAPVSVSWGAIS